MEVKTFIANYLEAFGEHAGLPLVFWYSDEPFNDPVKINGCFMKCLPMVREGINVSLDAEGVKCGGGKFYTGFSGMPEMVPNFVSLKERYKETPQQVHEFIRDLDVPQAAKPYLNFARIDQIETFDDVEGILFLATPDILSGLLSWTYFDNNSADAVCTPFGSGCSATITQAVVENSRNGDRTFLGGFDPSVRPCLDPDHLTFMIPLSRFRKMYETMRSSCLFDTHAWRKVRERIDRF